MEANKDLNPYRKGSDNFSRGSNNFFGNIKSISTTPDENQTPSGFKEFDKNDDDDTSSTTTIDTNNNNNNKPKTFVDGALKGVWHLGAGVLNGAKGIIEQPYKGAKKDGFTGFAKGVAKGVSGVVVLPAVGVLEFFSYTTQGIYNTPITVIDAMRSAPKQDEEEMIIVEPDVQPLFFTVDLEQSIKNANEKGVPHLLKVCIEFISKRKDVEGIFRISGSKLLIDEIQKKFDLGLITSVDDLDPKWVYEVACIFSKYFRYLPHSIIPIEQNTEFYRIQRNVTNPTDKASLLKEAVNSIKDPNYTVIYQCLSLLDEISLNSKENLMTPGNLSIVFGPGWLRPEQDIQDIANANTIVFNLISFFHQIFIKNPDLSILKIEKSSYHIKPMIQK